MKKRNIYRMLSAMLCATVFAACAGSPKQSTEADDGFTEVIRDRSFEYGFSVSPLTPEIVQRGGGFGKTNTDTIYFVTNEHKPAWQMAQWHSRYDLAGTTPEKKDSTVTFRNNGKRMVRSDAGTLLLEITTSTEYDKPRTESEPWPHLLIQQDFEVRPNIGKLEKLIFSIDLKLDKCENKMTESQLDPYMHTAQSPLYFVLKNVNSQSPDYNYSIWFGIPSFDYRYTKMTEEPHVAWDKGTSMYMYQCAQLPVWGDISFHDNQWHTANIDILPLIVSAVDTMKIKGNLLETQLSDLELTGMNFGWEIPGTFDAGIFIKNLSLKMKESETLTETTN